MFAVSERAASDPLARAGQAGFGERVSARQSAALPTLAASTHHCPSRGFLHLHLQPLRVERRPAQVGGEEKQHGWSAPRESAEPRTLHVRSGARPSTRRLFYADEGRPRARLSARPSPIHIVTALGRNAVLRKRRAGLRSLLRGRTRQRSAAAVGKRQPKRQPFSQRVIRLRRSSSPSESAVKPGGSTFACSRWLRYSAPKPSPETAGRASRLASSQAAAKARRARRAIWS